MLIPRYIVFLLFEFMLRSCVYVVVVVGEAASRPWSTPQGRREEWVRKSDEKKRGGNRRGGEEGSQGESPTFSSPTCRCIPKHMASGAKA